ncbi:hypothetical protein ACQEV2_00735 [Streptomyces sp. CA-251387]|uniref:hypothetical protein n=1 Tax=Streptomyces sp. CA-251387 TaxID=3240064 RepID=UPI003D917129
MGGGDVAVRTGAGQRPGTDTVIRHEVRLGPFRLVNETVVRRREEGVCLELEAPAGRLGMARIASELARIAPGRPARKRVGRHVTVLRELRAHMPPPAYRVHPV